MNLIRFRKPENLKRIRLDVTDTLAFSAPIDIAVSNFVAGTSRLDIRFFVDSGNKTSFSPGSGVTADCKSYWVENAIDSNFNNIKRFPITFTLPEKGIPHKVKLNMQAYEVFPNQRRQILRRPCSIFVHFIGLPQAQSSLQ